MVPRISWVLLLVVLCACKSGGTDSEQAQQADELRVQRQRCMRGNQFDCDTVGARLQAAGKSAAARPLLAKGCRLSQAGRNSMPFNVKKSEICKRAEAAGAKPEDLYPLGLLRNLRKTQGQGADPHEH